MRSLKTHFKVIRFVLLILVTITLQAEITKENYARDLKSGKELIWFSQRDGWAHLYLYDLKNGKLKNQKTSGPGLSEGWNVWRKTYLQHIKDTFR